MTQLFCFEISNQSKINNIISQRSRILTTYYSDDFELLDYFKMSTRRRRADDPFVAGEQAATHLEFNDKLQL
jgi:hypothetical protein